MTTAKAPVTDDAANRPLISIVTASYNAARHLPDLIASLRSQSMNRVEWVVIDGGSCDGTVAILDAASDIITTSISEPDNGIYDAWNKGVAASRGDWIMFLGADDYLLPGAVERYLAMLSDAGDDINMVVATVEWVDEDDRRVLRTVSRPWDWTTMTRWMSIAHPGTLHRRDLFDRFGTFDTRFRSAADYDFLLRAGLAIRALHQPEVVARVRVGGASHQWGALIEAQRARYNNLPVSQAGTLWALVVAAAKLAVRKNLLLGC